MDYKQKYEQLTKFIKDLYPHMSDYCKEKTEGMIPELKDGEDEKIKTNIIKLLRFVRDTNHQYSDECNESIAWLEKQDPKKHEEELENAYKCADEVQYRKGYEDAKREFLKQDEQKPAWSEEDENGLGDALWAVQQARSIAKDENEMGGLWYAEKWLKSLKERMKGE